MRSHLGEDDCDDQGTVPGGQRIMLRQIRTGDWAKIEALAANPEIGAHIRTAAQTRDSDATMFAVIDREAGEIIGQTGFQRLADVPAPVELTIGLDPARWGKGLGTEAVHALIDHAFGDGRIAVLWGVIRVTNTRARRVLEKSGFQFRGSGMHQSAAACGAFPAERFVLDRRNWACLKAWGADAA
jgi:RimJ/RimL family protein N-acetyltransferase